MESLMTKKSEIALLDSDNQAISVNSSAWEKYKNGNVLPNLISSIFNGNISVSITRKEIFAETDAEKKIVKTLMWGYPRGNIGPANPYMKNILDNLEKISAILSKNCKKSFDEAGLKKLIEDISNCATGLGISTISKLIYFFEISLKKSNDGLKCLIFDSNVEKALNGLDVDMFALIKNMYGEWNKDDKDQYPEYVAFMNSCSKVLELSDSAKLELFLFDAGKNL